MANLIHCCCSVAQSCLTHYDSLQSHVLQHTRLPCHSLSPGLCSDSWPLSLMSSSHLILCHPLLPLPSVFPSSRVLSNKLTLHNRWPKYWRFSIRHSSEYSGLISFRIDWLDLLCSPRERSLTDFLIPPLFTEETQRCECVCLGKHNKVTGEIS